MPQAMVWVALSSVNYQSADQQSSISQWPPDITANVVSDLNPMGTITNSDLNLAELVILWLMVEHVCGPLAEKHVALFSDNNPTVSWVQRMACHTSLID